MRMTTLKIWMQLHRKLLLLGGPLAFVILLYLFYLLGGRYISTEDASLRMARVRVSANVPGKVLKVYGKENQWVHQGDLLFCLDSRPYALVLMQAQAKLEAARLQVLAMKENQQVRCDLLKSEETKDQLSQEDKKNTQPSVLSAQDKACNKNIEIIYQAAWHDLLTASSASSQSLVDRHPLVVQAQAVVAKAALDLASTIVKAPMDGILAKIDQLQPGDYIAAGQPLFALISLNDLWVDANFKETELAELRAGQAVNIIVDAFPRLQLKGKVESKSPGTGASFSLLPPENATGNWVKVVQRVPVRIRLEHAERLPFVVQGLSVEATVDTGYRRINRWLRNE